MMTLTFAKGVTRFSQILTKFSQNLIKFSHNRIKFSHNLNISNQDLMGFILSTMNEQN